MTVSTGTPDDETLVATVTVGAGIEHTFAALTEPAGLAAWFWPKRLQTSYHLDVREGGEFQIRSQAMDMALRGRYLQVNPPTSLAMTWQWDGEPHHSQVTIDLTGDGDATVVTVTHRGHPSVEARDLHVRGWQDCLTRLVSPGA
jgi:uncharacterized protein YndB with AHSA1/START domain